MLLHAKAASTTWLCMEFVMGDGYFTVIHYFAPFSIILYFNIHQNGGKVNALRWIS